MSLFVDALPVLVVLVALLTGRVTALQAGLLGLAVALASAIGDGRAASWLATQSLRGAWLAWHAIAVIGAGMVFHRAMQHKEQGAFDAPGSAGDRRSAVFSACFVLGTFMESVTGFGVGAIIALGVLLRLGLPAVEAAALSLFSQVLVPWGALAVGTRIGAEIAGVPLADFGEASAQLAAFVLPPLLLPFWWLLARAGVASSAADRLADLLRIVVLVALVWLCTRYIGVELGGALPTGAMLVAQWLVDRRRAGQRLRISAALRAQWPYVLLVGGLLSTRILLGLSDAAAAMMVLDPFDGFAPMSVLRHPATWLALVAVVLMFVTPRSSGALREGLSAAMVPMLATLIYVELAQFFAGSGAAAALGSAWTAFAGSAAPFASPALGAFAGALTGSNTASNAIMLPVQTGLAEASGLPVLLLAATNNVAGSVCTLLTPARIVMVARVADCMSEQRRVYLATAPIGVVVILALLLAQWVLGR